MMTPLQQKEFEQTSKQARALFERALAMTDSLRIMVSMHNQDLAKQISNARHDLATPLSTIFNAATIAAIQPKSRG